jgi:Mn2+/Fe2+ NRAMP family transporter
MTLFVNSVVILGSAFTGTFGNDLPYAHMKVGAFEVNSRTPGGAAFIIFVCLCTGVLAGSLLYWMKRRAAHVD